MPLRSCPVSPAYNCRFPKRNYKFWTAWCVTGTVNNFPFSAFIFTSSFSSSSPSSFFYFSLFRFHLLLFFLLPFSVILLLVLLILLVLFLLLFYFSLCSPSFPLFAPSYPCSFPFPPFSHHELSSATDRFELGTRVPVGHLAQHQTHQRKVSPSTRSYTNI